jgi:hypothetical protein
VPRGRPPAVRLEFRGWPPTLRSVKLRGRPPAVRLGFRGWPQTLEDLESLEDGLLLKSFGNPVRLRGSDTLDNAVHLKKERAFKISSTQHSAVDSDMVGSGTF